MERVFIVGVGMTPLGKLLDRSVKDLTRASVEAAIRDTGRIGLIPDVAFFSNVMQGHMEAQHCIRGEIALRSTGIEGILQGGAGIPRRPFGRGRYLRRHIGQIPWPRRWRGPGGLSL